MGTVVDLEARRVARPREQSASRHPALRWVTDGDPAVAHRRTVAGHPPCGAQGDLTLAPPGVPLCPRCYQPEGR
jgi:hypothetical protein